MSDDNKTELASTPTTAETAPTELSAQDDPLTGTEGAAATGRRSTSVATNHTVLEDFGPADDLLKAGGRQRIIKERFVLEQRLGKGGMGEVYRAMDLRKQEARDDRPHVAIKFLGEAFSRHPQALVSLQREAKKTQALAHPNIVTVYDFDRDGTHVYMTMELLDGQPLSSWKASKPKEKGALTREAVITQLADGLAYAHSKGFVHSDLKPDNVFVTSDGTVKILDFGIARMADAAADSFDAGDLGALTRRYAALEMLERSAEPAPADDIYALGIIAYQLYAGEHPFGGLPADEALKQKLTPARPAGLSGYRWQALRQALQLRRADRTVSAPVFLQGFTGARRRRRLTGAMALVLLASVGFFAYQASRESGPSIPFEDLPASVQAELTEKLTRGQQSIAIGDWDGASRYFMDSWELHPRNPDARAGLAEIVEKLAQRVTSAGSKRELELLQRFSDAYAEHPYFTDNERFLALRRDLANRLR